MTGTPFDFVSFSRIGDKERLTGAIDGGGKPGIDHAFCVYEADPDGQSILRDVAALKADGI